MSQRYLAGLPEERRAELHRVNGDGLGALREILDAGRGLAFLGAGVSAPLYPLWAGVISVLIDEVAGRLGEDELRTCRELATGRPDAVVGIVQNRLGEGAYHAVLRRLFAPRKDPATQRTWTGVHELVVRCNLAGVITTNYDPGIANARMAVRTEASATGFASWADEDLLVRWRQGTVFGDDELPLLFAHGLHSRPESIVLATSEYRKAYRGMLGAVLGQLLDTRRAVWIGFSFTDRRIETVLQEIGDRSSTATTTTPEPRHVAVLGWDPSEAPDPGVIRTVMESQFGCRVVLYPTPDGDHSALGWLLAEFTEERYPPATIVAEPTPPTARPLVMRWVHGGERVPYFTGRAEELARLTRWARDPQVRLIGVTAWGGAGKTALVTEWLAGLEGARHRPGVRGVFAWSFYERNSAEEWTTELLDWVHETFGVIASSGPLARRVVAVLSEVPLVLLLDGLEVGQEGPAGDQFGRLLDGTLRAVLTALCQVEHAGLVLLTSRFPFADLAQFDGGAARMTEVPPFTPDEGATVLARAGGGWLAEADRLDLVHAVDGHALAVGALAGALADRPPTADLAALRAELLEGGRTDARVGKVLQFYADRLTVADRALVAIVGLFQRPVPVATVLALGDQELRGALLSGWTSARVQEAVRQRLSGLLSWHLGGTLSAHPLVRDAFRPLVLTGDTAQLAADTALSDLPAGTITTREDALRVVEVIELLLDANQWEAADRLYDDRVGGDVWKHIPAARLGQRCAAAFVGTPSRQDVCRERLGAGRLNYYVAVLGLLGAYAGDLGALAYLKAVVDNDRAAGNGMDLAMVLADLAEAAALSGDVAVGTRMAEKGLAAAEAAASWHWIIVSRVFLGWARHLAGMSATAEASFLAADLIECADEPDGMHLYSLGGIFWASLLAHTGRVAIARLLTEQNWAICAPLDWCVDVARCDRELGRCDLIEGCLESAGRRLLAAAEVFHDGEFLVEWADTLPDLAEQRRRTDQLDEAERLCTEAITFAGPRGLVPAHARALAERARARGSRFIKIGDRDQLDRGRDDADAALRLATITRRLPWQELDALRAHAHLDHLGQRDHGWQARAEQLHAELVPPGLDPDPLATVEARVAEQRRADGQR